MKLELMPTNPCDDMLDNRVSQFAFFQVKKKLESGTDQFEPVAKQKRYNTNISRVSE